MPSLSRAEMIARLFDAIREGVYIGNLALRPGERDETLAVNPHLRQMFGYPPEAPEREVRPFEVVHFVDPQGREEFLAELRKQGGVSNHPLRLRRDDGHQVWVEVTATAGRHATQEGAASDPRTITPGTRGPAARATRLLIDALVRDVSDRKRVEHRTRDLYHQLLQAEKLAALGQTVSGVAHELNNPLASILSWAERLAARPADEGTRRGLNAILTESERAARIVRNLLTFARKRPTTRTLVDINQVVRETLALRAYEHRVTNITVVDALAAGLPPVFADAHQLQQVLLNLVMNAEQAMLAANGRGLLVVRTWVDPTRGMVLLEVNDDGPGVPEEALGRIFDPFFTTKEVGKGTGLGLTVAYAIVQEHDGRIWVESPPEGGASFFVELPAGEMVAQAQPLAAGTAVAEGQGRTARVLIVEDEPALAAAVAEAFADAGFEAERAGDGEEALALVGDRAYDVVVCDLKMPRVDGMQFYRAIAATAGELSKRVIFVTGDVAGTDAERFLEETGCRWLSKPFRLADLVGAARDVIG